MDKDLQLAKDIITKILYINIASITSEGMPWNTAVLFAFDDEFNLYWKSWKENQHSKNIVSNPNVFITIYDSTVPMDTGEGIYIKAKAYELSNENEINHGLKYFSMRTNKPVRLATDFLNEHPRRVFKAVPEQIWLNKDSSINGEFIDIRAELELDQLKKYLSFK